MAPRGITWMMLDSVVLAAKIETSKSSAASSSTACLTPWRLVDGNCSQHDCPTRHIVFSLKQMCARSQPAHLHGIGAPKLSLDATTTFGRPSISRHAQMRSPELATQRAEQLYPTTVPRLYCLQLAMVRAPDGDSRWLQFYGSTSLLTLSLARNSRRQEHATRAPRQPQRSSLVP